MHGTLCKLQSHIVFSMLYYRIVRHALSLQVLYVPSLEWRITCLFSKSSVIHCAVKLSMDIGDTLKLQMSVVKLTAVTFS